MKYLKFLFALSLSTTIANADSSDVSQGITNGYNAIFSFVHSWTWLFAVIPTAIFAYSVFLASKKVKENANNSQGKTFSAGEIVGIYVGYGVGSLLSVFISYGAFGTIYANAASFGEVWTRLVTDFWSSYFL